MAKSLRSKWRRKMRAEKRVRYGEKELQQLKNMLTAAGDYQMVGESEAPMDEPEKIPINALPRPKSLASIKRKNRTVSRKSRLDEFADDDEEDEDAQDVEMNDQEESGEQSQESMSVDKQPRVFSKRTFKDQFGNYPVWMNKRKIMTQQKKNKRIKRNRAMSVGGKKRSGGKRR